MTLLFLDLLSQECLDCNMIKLVKLLCLNPEIVNALTYLQNLGGNSSDMLDDQRPTIEEILVNLQETTRNLREFSRTLADQPDALIRGKNNQGRKNGEKK